MKSLSFVLLECFAITDTPPDGVRREDNMSHFFCSVGTSVPSSIGLESSCTRVNVTTGLARYYFVFLI
jgi:hypothetical protein